jgi:hypothetical protein
MLSWMVVASGTQHSLARRVAKYARTFRSASRPNPLALRQSSRYSPTHVPGARLVRGHLRSTQRSMCDAGIAGRLRSL